jgi:hypothetical protein
VRDQAEITKINLLAHSNLSIPRLCRAHLSFWTRLHIQMSEIAHGA